MGENVSSSLSLISNDCEAIFQVYKLNYWQVNEISCVEMCE